MVIIAVGRNSNRRLFSRKACTDRNLECIFPRRARELDCTHDRKTCQYSAVGYG